MSTKDDSRAAQGGSELTVDKLVRLIRRATLPCTKAGGRFGEDSCGRCPNCQLRGIR